MLTADEKLTAIRQKIKRAKKHLIDLEAERDRFFAEDNPNEVLSYDDPDTGEHVYELRRVDPVSPLVGLIAGDVLHNTRSALDHLVYQLVIANGNTPSSATMFPVFNVPTDCVATNAGQIKGLSKTAKEKIRDAEPYKGGKGDLFWMLHKLDIADKHHALLTSTVCMGSSLLGYGSSAKRPGPYVEVVTFGSGPAKFGESLKAGDKFLILPKGHTYQNVRFDFDIGISEPNIIKDAPIVMLLSTMIAHADNLILDCKSELV